MVISSAVGTTWNSTELSKKEIPLHTTSVSNHRRRRIHSLGTAIDSPRESTRLSRQVEPNVKIEQVRKDVPCDASNRVLGDTGKNGVAKLGEESCSYSGESIYTLNESLSSWEEKEGHTSYNDGSCHGEYSLRSRRIDNDVQGIDDALEEERHLHIQDLSSP